MYLIKSRFYIIHKQSTLIRFFVLPEWYQLDKTGYLQDLKGLKIARNTVSSFKRYKKSWISLTFFLNICIAIGSNATSKMFQYVLAGCWETLNKYKSQVVQRWIVFAGGGSNFFLWSFIFYTIRPKASTVTTAIAAVARKLIVSYGQVKNFE